MTNKKLTYQELEIQVAELKKQNENLLKLNQRAEDNVERFKNLVNHSPDIIYKYQCGLAY